MEIVVYKDAKGNIHEIPTGTPFKKGADWVQIETKPGVMNEMDDSISKIAKSVGLSVDEVLTRLTKAFGIKQCPRCQLRSQILKEMGKLGWIESLRRLHATFKKAT